MQKMRNECSVPPFNAHIYNTAKRYAENNLTFNAHEMQFPRDVHSHDDIINYWDTVFEEKKYDRSFCLVPDMNIARYSVEKPETLATARQICDDFNSEMGDSSDVFTLIFWKQDSKLEAHWESLEVIPSLEPISFSLGRPVYTSVSGFVLWNLYYNTPFRAPLPKLLGVATFKAYEEPILPYQLFETERETEYKTFTDYFTLASQSIMNARSLFISPDAKQFQIDKDKQLWVKYIFWKLVRAGNDLQDALLATGNRQLFFDQERCYGLESVRRSVMSLRHEDINE